MQTNVLYCGDNLDILRRYLPDAAVEGHLALGSIGRGGKGCPHHAQMSTPHPGADERGGSLMDEATARAMIADHFATAASDQIASAECYADDAVLEFPRALLAPPAAHPAVSIRPARPNRPPWRALCEAWCPDHGFPLTAAQESGTRFVTG
jgi:hypothetical protein